MTPLRSRTGYFLGLSGLAFITLSGLGQSLSALVSACADPYRLNQASSFRLYKSLLNTCINALRHHSTSSAPFPGQFRNGYVRYTQLFKLLPQVPMHIPSSPNY